MDGLIIEESGFESKGIKMIIASKLDKKESTKTEMQITD